MGLPASASDHTAVLLEVKQTTNRQALTSSTDTVSAGGLCPPGLLIWVGKQGSSLGLLLSWSSGKKSAGFSFFLLFFLSFSMLAGNSRLEIFFSAQTRYIGNYKENQGTCCTVLLESWGLCQVCLAFPTFRFLFMIPCWIISEYLALFSSKKWINIILSW